jgi:cell division protein FtsQ
VHQTASKDQLKQRRRQLRQQQRVRVVKSLWRFVCTIGIVVGLAWVVNQPDWRISKPEQIRIEGNQYLRDATIRSMLAIPYPKLMMELAPEQLTAKLIQRSSVANVKIDRGLLPPHLLVQLQDFPPVAGIIQADGNDPQNFIDERGLQLPLASYRATVWRSLPGLRLRLPLPSPGACPNWSQIYQAVRASPVAIGIIDCRNPQDLILQTEVGKVRLGAIGDKVRITNQIQQLDRLRDWQKHTDSIDVDYLDLENPDAPKFKLKEPVSTPSKPILKSE